MPHSPPMPDRRSRPCLNDGLNSSHACYQRTPPMQPARPQVSRKNLVFVIAAAGRRLTYRGCRGLVRQSEPGTTRPVGVSVGPPSAPTRRLTTSKWSASRPATAACRRARAFGPAQSTSEPRTPARRRPRGRPALTTTRGARLGNSQRRRCCWRPMPDPRSSRTTSRRPSFRFKDRPPPSCPSQPTTSRTQGLLARLHRLGCSPSGIRPAAGRRWPCTARTGRATPASTCRPSRICNMHP